MPKISFHKEILEWQAAHPTLTWIFWGIVWAIILSLLLAPHLQGIFEHQQNAAGHYQLVHKGEPLALAECCGLVTQSGHSMPNLGDTKRTSKDAMFCRIEESLALA